MIYNSRLHLVIFPSNSGDMIHNCRRSSGDIGVYRAAEVAKTPKTALRYIVSQGIDHAHHLVPLKEFPKLNALRRKLKWYSVDLNTAVNGVSLPKKFHQSYTRTNAYADRLLRLSRNWNTREDIIKGLDDLAEALLKESGKIK